MYGRTAWDWRHGQAVLKDLMVQLKVCQFSVQFLTWMLHSFREGKTATLRAGRNMVTDISFTTPKRLSVTKTCYTTLQRLKPSSPCFRRAHTISAFNLSWFVISLSQAHVGSENKGKPFIYSIYCDWRRVPEMCVAHCKPGVEIDGEYAKPLRRSSLEKTLSTADMETR